MKAAWVQMANSALAYQDECDAVDRGRCQGVFIQDSLKARFCFSDILLTLQDRK